MFTHVHVYDTFNFELTVYAEDKAHYVFKSRITGKADRAGQSPANWKNSSPANTPR